MTDSSPTDQTAAIAHDPLPLLPRGSVVFTDLPARAVVMDALAPVIGDGTLVVREPNRGAVILVRNGDVLDVHVAEGGVVNTGVNLLASVQTWADASVSAERLESSLVDLSEALLRGDTVYDDLRLMWVNWPSLLEDLGQRGGTFVVEITTPVGRGVTCVAAGRQAQSYTDIHPSLGDPALLEAMATNHQGIVRVRRVGAADEAVAGERGGAEESAPEPQPSADQEIADSAPSTNGTGATSDHPTSEASHWPVTTLEQPASTTDSAVQSEPEAQEVATDSLPDAGWVAPWDTAWRGDAAEGGVAVEPAATDATAVDNKPATWNEFKTQTLQPGAPSVAEVLDDLRAIARRRLGLSAERVEVVLDEGALAKRSLLSVLDEVRSMSIRGVMQSTLEQMVDEMAEAARRSA
ncbi:MAG TPA: hypothetical protein VH498_04375 [Candidatus Dormibacteraeota bacterium]|nr:hypothetical protein [Candidatus Dormibacteraeota bacterium]